MSYHSVFPFLKSYLYTKNGLKYYIIMLATLLFTSCTIGGGKNAGISYDMPPTAPIPPEKFCFEQKDESGKITANVALSVIGDSVVGMVEYGKSENLPSEKFSGVIYGTTILVKSKYNTEKGAQSTDKQWKLEKDKLYMPVTKKLPDSLSTGDKLKEGTTVTIVCSKVPCN